MTRPMNDIALTHGRAHDHHFGQQRTQPGQQRTAIVLVLTVVMMLGEIAAGLAFGSIALLADGLHMGSHAVALGVALFAYALARRYSGNPRFSFGTGKMNSLGGFASAFLLAAFAVVMLIESMARWFAPVDISFDQALIVAVLGLVVNGVSALLLGGGHAGQETDGRTSHGHHQENHHHEPHGDRVHHQRNAHQVHHERATTKHGHAHAHWSAIAGDDHNLRGAYLHVAADALTSVLAIVALLVAKYTGALWMDPAMGVVGAIIVLRWSIGLARVTGQVLLDGQAAPAFIEAIRSSVESAPVDRIADLHVWSIGPGLWAAELVVVSTSALAPDEYRARLPHSLNLVHVTIEVRSSAVRFSP